MTHSSLRICPDDCLFCLENYVAIGEESGGNTKGVDGMSVLPLILLL